MLWNGKWHYEKITKNHSVKQVQNRDKIKIEEIKKAGYIPYIIKDTGKYNTNKVIDEFNLLLENVLSRDSLMVRYRAHNPGTDNACGSPTLPPATDKDYIEINKNTHLQLVFYMVFLNLSE